MRIAIIGAGVAGCYCAYRLARAGHSVDLFEMSDRIGGRLWSVPIEGVTGAPAEIGGMFFSDIHQNTHGLITRELKLPSRAVSWSRRHQYLRGKYLEDEDYENGALIPFNLEAGEVGKRPTTLLVQALQAIVPAITELWPLAPNKAGASPQATMAYLRSLQHDGRPLHDWGFWNLLAEVVSNEAYNLLLATVGSAAIFRNGNACDAIWTFLMEVADQNFFAITEGYQALPEQLVRAAGENCRVSLGCQLIGVDHAVDHFVLDFDTPGGRSSGNADVVILALPKRALELIDLNAPIVATDRWRDLLSAVVPVPACKLFMVFDHPWWNLSSVGPETSDAMHIAVAYTDLPMRQCYYFGAPGPTDPALLMTTYADDVASAYWAALRDPGYCLIRTPGTPSRGALCSSLAMEERALKQLGAMHRDYAVPRPTDALFFDWGADPYGGAWHAWAPYNKSWKVSAEIRQPNTALNLFVCGEAFSHTQGWVEGALNSAEMVLQRLGLGRPDWVDRDYQFEIEQET